MIWGIPIDDHASITAKMISKNLFSHIKTPKSESSNIPELRKDGIVTSDPNAKANALNFQFQNAFTRLTEDTVPNKGNKIYPQIKDIHITEAGNTKLLKNINIHKQQDQS